MGVDAVIESYTKFVSGHSDVMMGGVISNGKNSIGLIAQDVEEVDASSYFTGSFINENNVEMKTVDYSKMVVPLVKAVQELSDEIERLKKEIEELKK